jgi:hypothetical protein
VRSFSAREKGLALVFLLALLWGAWNYRHLFADSDSPGMDSRAARPASAAHAVATGAKTSGTPVGAVAARLPDSAWGSDPFDRSWRHPGSPPTPPGAAVNK